jgi:bromodomain-containing protein 7/9
MDDIDLPSNDVPQPGSSQNGGSRTGLRLILPPLSSVKALKGKKKGSKGVAFQEAAAPKVSRPVKLKPLKEVLTKLVTQIKKYVVVF